MVFAGLVLAATAGFAAEPVPVVVAHSKPATTAETLRLSGTVTAERSAGLSPRTSGLVDAVHVDAGDRVQRGDVLLELDRVLAELALRRAEAALSEAQTQLSEAQRLERQAAKLVKDNHIPETEARASEANVRLNTASVARLETEVREAAERLERHSLIAPFAGVISRKLTEVGEWVETGTPVLELVGTERLRIDVQVPQERFTEIDEDTPVSVYLDGLPDRSFGGLVAAKVPVNDPAARTFLVRVIVDEPGNEMTSGMLAQAVFSIRGARDAVAVPRDAIVRSPDGANRVWVVEQINGEMQVTPRDIQLGRSLAETVEIVSGLEPALPVVVRGNESLREGQRVRVIAEN